MGEKKMAAKKEKIGHLSIDLLPHLEEAIRKSKSYSKILPSAAAAAGGSGEVFSHLTVPPSSSLIPSSNSSLSLSPSSQQSPLPATATTLSSLKSVSATSIPLSTHGKCWKTPWISKKLLLQMSKINSTLRVSRFPSFHLNLLQPIF
jgi:hypothetical protein